MSLTVLGTAGTVTMPLHLAPVSVEAGFPSPAQDYYDGPVDLTRELVKDAAATFFLRVSGSSMEQARISDGGVLIVDRSLTPKHGDVVIAVLDGELTVKRLIITGRGVILRPDNPAFPDILVAAESELVVWGVVKVCLHYLVDKRRAVHGA